MKRILVVIIMIVFSAEAYSQFIEDALRYTNQKGMINPRAGALGVSYAGISDDGAALFYNPAGLSLIPKNELSFGFGLTGNNTETDFLNSNNTFKVNNSFLSHMTLSSPFQMDNEDAVISLGYYLEDDFNNSNQINNVNSISSYINSEASYGPRDEADNWAYQLFLADNKGTATNGIFKTHLNDSLNQNVFTQEKGGLHDISAGLGFNLNEMVSLGISMTGKWGTYSYQRDFEETDSKGIYNNQTIDTYLFKSFNAKEYLTQDVSGFTAAIGVQVKLEGMFRLGATIKLPTWYRVEENFNSDYRASYHNNTDRTFSYSGKNSYDLRTPFVYSAGMSFHYTGLTLSAAIEYNDVSQLTFSDAIPQVMDLNTKIVKELIGQTNWGIGAEYEVPMLPICVRGSYSSISTPYQNNIAGSDWQVIGLGAGIYAGKGVRIDITSKWSKNTEVRTLYYDTNTTGSIYKLANNPFTVSLGLTYRY